MISDDLAPLFGNTGPAVRFRQGTVLSWDSSTGENTIQLGGGTLTNVPILNTGEAIALKAGHIVGLLGQGASWFIIGRVTPPNDPNFAGASVAFGSATAFEQGFAQPATLTQQAAGSITVPAWVDEAAVICIVTATLVNNLTSTRVEGLIAASIDGVIGSSMATGIESAAEDYSIGAMTAVTTSVITDPGPTINVACLVDCTFALAANGVNTATANAIAIFRSIA